MIMNEKLSTQVEKQKRLEKALRENLRKRKAQQREREDKEKTANSDLKRLPEQKGKNSCNI
jgi:hypothetical protein